VIWLEERPAARHRVRVSAEEHADDVLGLLDLALRIRQGPGRGSHEDLGLAHVDEGGHGALFPELHESQRILTRGQRPPGHLQLRVERTAAGSTAAARSLTRLLVTKRRASSEARRSARAALGRPPKRPQKSISKARSKPATGLN